MHDLVAELLRERTGYISRDLPDRVAAIDAVLARLGHPQPGGVPETTALEALPEKAIPPRPRANRKRDIAHAAQNRHRYDH